MYKLNIKIRFWIRSSSAVNQCYSLKIESFFADAGGLANGNMFGNFARWNEPSRESSSKKVDYSLRGRYVSPTSFQQKMVMPSGESYSTRLHIQVE